MPAHSFESFLRTLQAAVGHAQRAASLRHQTLLERMTEVGADGTRSSRTWAVQVPPLPTDARGSATLRLPLLGLRRLRQPQVIGFSFEVDVEIELERGRYADGHPRMRLLIRKDVHDPGRESRRLRVSLEGPQPGGGEVLIDGALLKRLDGVPPVDVEGPLRAMFRRSSAYLSRLFLSPPDCIRLSVSEEDASRLRDAFAAPSP